MVVGVDDSDGARAALRWAAREASATDRQLRVVYAYDVHLAWIDRGNPDLPTWEAHARHASEDLLTRIVGDTLVSEQAGGFELHAVEGQPVEGLRDQARDADMVVVGTRGRGGFAGLLLGSVSQALAQHAPCPLVIVPRPDDESRDTPLPDAATLQRPARRTTCAVDAG